MEALYNSDLIVVGAGFFGSTVAECAARSGYRVAVIDKRDHIGGNAYSYRDATTGIEVHKYGPHIFHTNNKQIFDYLGQFTDWVRYEHRTWINAGKKIFPMPINLATISLFLNKAMSPAEAKRWIDENAGTNLEVTNLEDKAISLIGRPLYEAFIKGYTAKQWQTDPRQLPSDIITRLPVRLTFDNRYFDDEYQYMPKDGYLALFEKMLGHENITTYLAVDWFDIASTVREKIVLYTGPIDRYFDYRFGVLGWRTIDFEYERHIGDYQGCPIMNYADEDIPWTRITEFKHFHPERTYAPETIIAKEYSRFAGRNDEPYYPIKTQADMEKYLLYKRAIDQESNVVFGGRLATYKYIDMHQAVGSALHLYQTQLRPRLASRKEGEWT